MSEEVKTEPCLEGLTPACFRAHPEYAKRVFAYRLLQCLLPLDALKRLQKVPFKIWQKPLPVIPVTPITPVVPVYPPPTTPPLFVQPWEPGPITTTEGEIEGEIMADALNAKIDFATAATHEVIAAVATRKICITSMAFTVGGTTNLTLKSGSTAKSGAMDFGGTNEPRGLTHGLGEDQLEMAVGEAFNMTSSGAVQVGGYVTYHLE